MAKTPMKLTLVLIPFFVTAMALGGRFGGRTQVKDVENNKQVQELGRYCVQEYNRKLQEQYWGNGSSPVQPKKLLVFSRVVEAQTQVVSGIKYYLKISAATGSAAATATTFDAVVVVKPWDAAHSKELLDFAPSQPSLRNTK